MMEIQKRGPFTIVAETWSGGIAMLLSTLLSNAGHGVSVFLLQGVPARLHPMIPEEDALTEFLITTMLNINKTVRFKFFLLESFKVRIWLCQVYEQHFAIRNHNYWLIDKNTYLRKETNGAYGVSKLRQKSWSVAKCSPYESMSKRSLVACYMQECGSQLRPHA